eukprot:scaffold2221_cov368-Prasinococcus_capsulatus_cf.AAC.7
MQSLAWGPVLAPASASRFNLNCSGDKRRHQFSTTTARLARGVSTGQGTCETTARRCFAKAALQEATAGREGASTGPKRPESLRKVGVPYFQGAVSKDVLINGQARQSIERNEASNFVALPTPQSSPALRELLETAQDGWMSHEGIHRGPSRERSGLGSGHHSMWPEIFDCGEQLIRECFPSAAGGEVLRGT